MYEYEHSSENRCKKGGGGGGARRLNESLPFFPREGGARASASFVSCIVVMLTRNLLLHLVLCCPEPKGESSASLPISQGRRDDSLKNHKLLARNLRIPPSVQLGGAASGPAASDPQSRVSALFSTSWEKKGREGRTEGTTSTP